MKAFLCFFSEDNRDLVFDQGACLLDTGCYRFVSQNTKPVTDLPGNGHSVEDIPQNDSHHHLVAQVEDDALAIVVLLLCQWGRCGCPRLHAPGHRLRLTLGPDPSSCTFQTSKVGF